MVENQDLVEARKLNNLNNKRRKKRFGEGNDRYTKRANNLSIQEIEDIEYTSVQKAMDKLKDRRLREHRPIKFTGYWRKDTAQVYGMKRQEDKRLLFCIKGGPHTIVKLPMDGLEQTEFTLAILKIFGFKYIKRRGGYSAWIRGK